MANWSVRCDDPSAVIDMAGSLMATLNDTKESVQNLNTALGEHVGQLGEANDNIVNGLISIGGAAFQEQIDNYLVVINDSILNPAFDAYTFKYGTKHEKDNRADM